ncbi:MAG: hypothetical protein Q9204_006454 [Flavoplaca sp. TL-2023a]
MSPSATSPTTMTEDPTVSNLPLISLTPLLNPSSPSFTSASHALLSALRTSGFLYLTDYTPLIPPSTLTNIFTHSATFFARPQPQKDALASRSASSNRGYMRPGREKVSRGLTAQDVAKERQEAGEDMKETYEIGREGQEGNPQPWPDVLDQTGVEFRVAMQDFFLRCKELHVVVMRAVAVGLGLEKGFFDEMVHVGDNNLRLLHYPATARAAFKEGRVRAGEHSDYGSLTFLFQDLRGGLQVEKLEGGWMDVEPREGTIVVNAGDTLARWSNDLIRSTKHRVVEPPLPSSPFLPSNPSSTPSPNLSSTSKSPSNLESETEGHPPRYSIAYFCNPNYEVWIDALPGTWENVDGGKKYEGIGAREYLFSRLEATVREK